MVLASLCLTISVSAYDFEVEGVCYDITSFTDLTVMASSLAEDASCDVIIPNKVVFKGKELSVTEIASGFANGNENLISININAKDIGQSSFKNCISLNTIILQDSVRFIGEECFRGCINLKQVSLSDSIVGIGASSFRDCTNLISFCNKGIKEIGGYSFYNCKNLNSIDLPSLSYIPEYAFGACSMLSKCSTPNISSINEGAFIECESLECYNIPVYVNNIGSYAFKQTGLNEVMIPDNVTSLGIGVFDNCKNLVSATIGRGIMDFYPNFKECPNLVELTILDSYDSLNLIPYTSSDYDVVYGGEYAYAEGPQVTECSGYFSGSNLKNIYIGRNIKQPPYRITRAVRFDHWAIYGYDIGECTNEYYDVYNSPFSCSSIKKVTFGPYVSDIIMTSISIDNDPDSYPGGIQIKDYEGKGRLYNSVEDNLYKSSVSCTFRIKGIFEDCKNLEEIIFMGSTKKNARICIPKLHKLKEYNTSIFN